MCEAANFLRVKSSPEYNGSSAVVGRRMQEEGGTQWSSLALLEGRLPQDPRFSGSIPTWAIRVRQNLRKS